MKNKIQVGKRGKVILRKIKALKNLGKLFVKKQSTKPVILKSKIFKPFNIFEEEFKENFNN